MHLEFLVEEPSAEVALQLILPRILGQEVTFRIHPHGNKSHLIGNLAARLRGYARWLPSDWRIVVLVDEDRTDCHELKARLDQAARAVDLKPKSDVMEGERFVVLNRIAIEELEAWFFGDIEAIRRAYPRVPETLAQRAPFRNPDRIAGGTWEALERVLQRAGYHHGGLAKISAARDIAEHVIPERNRSHSFQVFRTGLLALLNA